MRAAKFMMTVVVAALVVLAAIGITGCQHAGDGDGAVSVRSHSGTWHRLPAIGRARGESLSELAALRVAQRIVIVAGASADATVVKGLRLDPGARRWTRLPQSPLRWRTGHTALAAKHDVIVWGGTSNVGTLADGARYDTVDNTWQRLMASPLRGRHHHTAVWTGSRMLVWGGLAARRRNSGRGAAYDPRRDRWEPIRRSLLAGRHDHTAIWTGTQMIIWGGTSSRGVPEDDDFIRGLSDGAVYDPRTDRWRRMASAPIRSSFSAHAVWTGSSMLVWTGEEGAVYTPRTNRWHAMRRAPLSARDGFTATWTGQELLIWGGARRGCGDCFLADGAAYDPSTDRWRELPPSPLSPRELHAAVRLEGGMILWGGCCSSADRGLSDGASYKATRRRP